MTNSPPMTAPHRQDDRLLLRREILAEKLADCIHLQGTIAVHGGRELHVSVTREEITEIVTALCATPASRDGADGTGDAEKMLREGRAITVIIPTGYDSAWDFLNDCGLEAVYSATPPKPAPDALRDALALIKEAKDLLVLAFKGPAYKSKINSAVWRLTYAERALSPAPVADGPEPECGPFRFKTALDDEGFITDMVRAPVPPADGDVSLIEAFTRLQRRLLSYCNHANAGHMPSDGREFARRILLGFQSAYEEAGATPPAIEPETATEYAAALAPLPAGAAEAVIRGELEAGDAKLLPQRLAALYDLHTKSMSHKERDALRTAMTTLESLAPH